MVMYTMHTEHPLQLLPICILHWSHSLEPSCLPFPLSADTQELSSQCESGDTFVISASQQVEVHKLLKGSDLTATPSSPVTTSATPMDTAEGAVGESMPPGSDCVRDSIVHVSPSGSGELEAAGAGEGLQVPLQQALKGDDVTVVVEGSAEGTQSCIPPTKKLRREEGSGADGNRDQEVSEQGQKEKEEHDNADEFFISGSQVTALWGQGADQCSVLEEEIRLTPQENELVAFSSSLEGEEGDVEFVEDSSCSAPLMIDLMKDSTSPDADDKSLMVGNGRGSGEGCSKSDGQLAVQEGTSSEGALDRKEDAGVGATGGVKCVLAGDAEKDSRPVHTEELSSEAVQGKAGVRSDAIRDAKEAEAVATEEGDIDDGMRVEAAMDVEESSGREHTENDSDFFTAHSEVEVSSPLSNQDLCLSSKAFVAPDEKGTPTTTTNTTIVVVDLVCEETTPKISEGLSDISHVSDSNKSFPTAPSQSGSRAVEGSKEVQDKFKIIVPERSEPSSIAVSIMEQDTAESSQVHSQPSQNCITSSSPSFTLITPDISLPAYQLPHSSCSSGTSLLTSTVPITSTAEDPAPRQRELLNKIVAYWRQRHLESPLSSDILCQFTASLDQQENTTVHRLRRRRRKRHH